jgi:hypothetical protein
MDALLVHGPPLPAQHHMDAQISESRPGVRDLAHAQPQC